MKSGILVLLLACLLVAVPAAAGTVRVSDVTFDTSIVAMFGTKINVQEEVPALGENMTALAVGPSRAMAADCIMTSEVSEKYVVYYCNRDGYEPTPGAGGDGPYARHF